MFELAQLSEHVQDNVQAAIAEIVAAAEPGDDVVASVRPREAPAPAATAGTRLTGIAAIRAASGRRAQQAALQSAAGGKRDRETFEMQLNEAVVQRVLGAEAQYTPLTYTFIHEPMSIVRLMDQPGSHASIPAPGRPLSLVGEATTSARVVPSPTDPLYAVHVARRRAMEHAAAASKKTTRLLGEGEDDGSMQYGPDGQPLVLRTVTDFSKVAKLHEMMLSDTSSGAASGGGRKMTLYQMFEKQAYWTLREMIEMTGRREGDLRRETQTSCDYVRSGPHRGTYKLKDEFRSATSVPAEANDGIVK